MAWHEINGYTHDSRNSACSICGTSQRTLHRGTPERVFTTGIDIYLEGTFDICEQCMREGASLLGASLPEHAKLDLSKLTEQREQITELESALEDAKTLIRSYEDVIRTWVREELEAPRITAKAGASQQRSKKQ